MRKIFSILAAAVIALSFASCEKTDPGMKFFHMKVTDITDSSAVLSITPADTTVAYYLNCYNAREVDEYNLDTLIASDINFLQGGLDGGLTKEQIIDYYLYQGPFGPYTADGLKLNTEYVFWAYEVVFEEDKVSLGRVAVKRFTTKTIPVVETVDLGALNEGVIIDLHEDEDYGFYFIEGWTEGEEENLVADVGVAIYEEKDLNGTYYYADIEPYFSGVMIPDETETVNRWEVVDAKITCNTKSNLTGKAKGWVVGSNGVKYKFSFDYIPDELAPARKGIKREFGNNEKNILPKIPTVADKRFKK